MSRLHWGSKKTLAWMTGGGNKQNRLIARELVRTVDKRLVHPNREGGKEGDTRFH
jgi:hypothetical protein